ncbi:MAG TPA: terminase TerL endonuclease subunit [Guyparkeria sp.]|nr:terminase TerL endonuclease subunit [Guyparkeria sp.]
MESAEVSDYVAVAVEYAQEAADDRNRERFGKWIRLAARRFLDDLKRAKKKGAPFTFDEWHANDPCDFIEKLPHVEGRWETPTIRLHRSDVFFLVNLFGFRNRQGGRRFTTALKAIARKNAKSTIAAGIALYCQLCEDEEGPQVISGATTGSQARIVFNIARRMVEKTPELREAFDVEAFASSIASYSNGGFFKPINAKASTQDGLNPSCSVLDEIHAHKDADLLNVIQSAAGARKNPLFLFTTTEGYESPGPWAELRHFAKQLLEGKVEADHFLAIYYAIDDDDDEFDERAWAKANPLMEVNPILVDEIRKAAIEAKGMPGKLAEFRIKRLNRQSESADAWVVHEHWKACAQPVDLEWLRQYPCWGGLDLASNVDLAAFRLLWYVDEVYYTWGRKWTCRKKVEQRSERGTVPYQSWIAAGYLEETPGEIIDYDVIEAAIREASEQFKILNIGYDKWNAAQLVASLKDDGVPMQEFIQGPKSYHPAMKEFERAYLAHQFAYGTDPVLTWCAANLVTRLDQNMNMAPDKRRSAEKIDDMVALLMAFGMAVGGKDTSSVYEQRGIRTL